MNQMIMFLMMINSFIFTQTNHPMSMGLILLVQTLLSCIFTGLMTKSFWFSYILFLIFIGGMLILFIYMASLASNEKFKFSMSNTVKLIFFMSLFFIIIFMDNFWFNSSFFNLEMSSLQNSFMLLKENFLHSSKMYDLPNNWIIIFMINYLLLTLIIIVKITNLYQGPLRSKN